MSIDKNTPSAMGERQIFPRQTKRIEILDNVGLEFEKFEI